MKCYLPRQWRVSITSVLNRKNGFARRAKLAQKLRWRKATESNFCDKVFIGFENHVRRYSFLQCLVDFIHFMYYTTHWGRLVNCGGLPPISHE